MPLSSTPFPASTPARDHLVLAIFGKHPAAADHLEDLGFTVPALPIFKCQFYTEGLGGCIERGIWAQDLPGTTPPPYDHHLLTVGAGGWISARFAASEDAAGRAQYPLVACLHGTHFETLLAIDSISAKLDRHLAAARAAATLERLHALQAGDPPVIFTPQTSPMAEKLAWTGTSRPGLDRFVHAISIDGAGARSVRVPLDPSSAARSAVGWCSFLSHLRPIPATTIIWRHNATFADLAPTPPTTALLHHLFASEKRAALITTVSFQIAPRTSEHASAALATWQSSPDLFPPAPVSVDDTVFLEKLRRDFRGWLRS